jgi:hypothetical protein
LSNDNAIIRRVIYKMASFSSTLKTLNVKPI